MMAKWILKAFVLLSVCTVIAYPQDKSQILDFIEQSIPKRESGWKLESSKRSDNLSLIHI